MKHDEGGTIERLYTRLATALQGQRSRPFESPVTVAEIYQELVPYRVLRGEAGFAMNADYEHALLRLLSGEGDWARLEPTSARDVILRELKSSNPNVTIYREYAGCDVWVRPPAQGTAAADDVDEITDEELHELELLASEIEEELAGQEGASFPRQYGAPSMGQADARAGGSGAAVGGSAAAASRAAGADTASGRNGGAADAAPGGAAAATPEAAGSETPSRGAAAAAAAASEPALAGEGRRAAETVAEEEAGRCVFCDSALPARRPVRFCPYCGGDQSMVPCGACGEALEPGWLYCIACGRPADGE